MSTHHQQDRFQAKVDQTAELLVAGAHVLNEMLTKDKVEGAVRFSKCADTLRGTAPLNKNVTTNDRLVWLWEAPRGAPDFTHVFAGLPSATVPWTSKHERFDVFHPGEWFVMGMKSREVAQLLKECNNAPQHERVSVQTKAQLRMKPGRGGRLERCDCHAEVTVQVEKVFEARREADIMRIEEDRSELGTGFFKVKVDSLNQAYTVSSRRLEPERRSHGGRRYDHVVHCRKGKRIRLEDIRQRVESRWWEVPEQLTQSTPHQSGRLFD